MNGVCRVLIIGDSLFTATLARMLIELPEVKIVGMVPSVELALAAASECEPHLIITAAGSPEDSFGPLLSTYPSLAIICADLNHDYLQVITSHRTGARRQDLLETIQAIHTDYCSKSRVSDGES